MHYHFERDLQEAKKKEKELADVLMERGKTEKIEFNDDYRYDLKVHRKGGGCWTIEVKNDMTQGRTGNIGVEFECRNKPSGIKMSEADYWCFALADGFWLIETAKLRWLIKQPAWHKIGVGGDVGSDTKMYLFKDWALKRYMTKLGDDQRVGWTWEEIGTGNR